jgi:ribosomal protein L7Ae-like RNA K-turn-binding protein
MDVDTLVTRMTQQGRRAFYDRLGLACRANALGIGHVSAAELLTNRPALVILAADSGAAGQRKFAQQAARKNVPILTVETGADTGRALGREFVSVVVVARSAFADDLCRWGRWLSRLDGTGIKEYEDPGSTVAGNEGRHVRPNTETPDSGQ